jgi:hypothetical protein
LSGSGFITTSNGGNIQDQDGIDITPILKATLAKGARLNLNGCQTGRGPGNLAQQVSQILKNRIHVKAGRGIYQLGIPYTGIAYGKDSHYVDGLWQGYWWD